MKKLKLTTIALAFASTVLFTGCASITPQYTLVDGSKADGMVQVNARFNAVNNQGPNDELDQVKAIAKEACKAWKYKGEPHMFGGKGTLSQEQAKLFVKPVFNRTYRFQCTD